MDNTIFKLKDKDHMESKYKHRYFCEYCLFAVKSLKDIWDHCKKVHTGREALAIKSINYDEIKSEKYEISDSNENEIVIKQKPNDKVSDKNKKEYS